MTLSWIRCLHVFRDSHAFDYLVEHTSGKNNVIAAGRSHSFGLLGGSDLLFIKEVELYAVPALFETASTPRLCELKN